MKNLESQFMPLRKGSTFYDPKIKIRSNSSIKVYPQKHFKTSDRLFPLKQLQKQKKEYLNPQSNYCTLNYLDQLYKTRTLQRRPIQKQQYYPSTKPWKKQCNKSNRNCSQISFQKFSVYQDTFYNLNSPKFRAKTKTPLYKKIISKISDKSKDEKAMTFYNNFAKDELILTKFKDWKNMDERGSPTYQNSMNRTIAATNILYSLKERDQKLRKGDWNF